MPTFYHQSSTTVAGAVGDPQHATAAVGSQDFEAQGNPASPSASNAAGEALILPATVQASTSDDRKKDGGLGSAVRTFLRRNSSAGSRSSSSSSDGGSKEAGAVNGKGIMRATYDSPTNVKEVWFVGCHSGTYSASPTFSQNIELKIL